MVYSKQMLFAHASHVALVSGLASCPKYSADVGAISLMSLKKQKGIEKLGNKSGLNLTEQEARPDTDC